MEIKVPPIEEQKKVVEKVNIPKLKPKKIRTSFELTKEAARFLESEAENEGMAPSELFRQIVEKTYVDTEQHQKRMKNLTVYQSHMEKLEQIADKLVPDNRKGKRSGNKSAAADILIKEYMQKV